MFVPVRSDLPVARVDLPTTPRDRHLVWNSIRDAFSRNARPGASVGIVCVTAERQRAEVTGPEFAARLDSIGIATHAILWANDSQWVDLMTGDAGLQTEPARERIAAMTVLNGRAQPAVSRESLATSLVGDRGPVTKLLPDARAAASRSTSRSESAWALRTLNRFHVDGLRLTEGDAARLLVAVDSIPIRDRLWIDMTQANASSHVSLWTDMTRRAPDAVRAAPASMLGFASWLSGNGALAWCALDQVPRDKPYAFAGIVAAVVQAGMHPREWEATRSQPSDRGTSRASTMGAPWSRTRIGHHGI